MLDFFLDFLLLLRFMPTRALRFYWLKVERFFRRIARSAGTSHSIALGVAIGFFIGWLPIVGFQMAVAAPICLLLGANFLAAIPPIWCTNPMTLVPIYGFNYWVGLLFVSGPRLSDFRQALSKMVEEGRDGTWREAAQTIIDLSTRFLGPLWLGSFLVGSVLAIVSYFLTFRAVEAFRHRLHHQRRKRHARIQEHLERMKNNTSLPGEESEDSLSSEEETTN